MLRAVTGLGYAAAGIIPEFMAIDFQQAAQGSSDPFLAMMRQSEDAISKAALGGKVLDQHHQPVRRRRFLPWARCITRFGTTYWHPMPANWRPRCPAICSGRSWY
ncbi:phage portal protein family protein [Pseudomonas aeruginosa]|uniref:phage portal protein family protein n=1 Tax=Pseudomonas aeruginosa TaxID=287 RepID=UPI003D6DC945